MLTPNTSARVIPRPSHGLSRQQVSENALKVLYRLKKSGYQAFLVGGCVRDLLLGLEPKDFDIATDASPQEIKNCFKNARIIGRRFRLAHILFRGEIIEVSTFRGEHEGELQQETHSEEGRILHDNVYGDIDEDAHRRDFTVNALYYNIADFSVLDFHHGMEDLEKGMLRIIGDAETRYREDPVRMLRAIRFAAKLGFRMEAATEAGIFKHGHLLSTISSHRLFTEVLKLFLGKNALNTFKILRHYKLFVYLFPETEKCLYSDDFANTNQLLNNAFHDTDMRLNQAKTVSPAYLFAVLLWHPLQRRLEKLQQTGMSYAVAFNIASFEVCQEQQKYVNIPRHFLATARTIWDLQYRLEKRKRNKCFALVEHPRFRAAYDFLLLRSRSGEEDKQQLYNWWENFYEAGINKRQQILNTLNKPHIKHK